MREAVEFAQRMDLDYEAVMVFDPDTLGHPTSRAVVRGADEADTLARFEEALSKTYELIVIGNVYWQTLPAYIREKLLEQVRAGAGLLYVYPDDSFQAALEEMNPQPAGTEMDTSPIPIGHVAHVQNDGEAPDGVSSLLLGAGRILTLTYPGIKATAGVCLTTDPLMPDYEYQMALVVRLAMMAAGRALSAVDLSIDVDARQGTTVRLSGRIRGEEAAADVIVRDRQNEVEMETSVPLSAGDSGFAAEVPIGVLKEGGHF